MTDAPSSAVPDRAAIAITVREARATGNLDTVVDTVRHALETGQFELLEALLEALRPADRVDVFEAFDLNEQRQLIEQIDEEAAAEVLEWMEDEDAAEVAGALVPEQLASILDQMDVDEAADVLGDLPPEQAELTLQRMDDAVEADVRELMAYGDETAGGRMTTDFVALRSDQSVAEVLEQLRSQAPDPQASYYLYVVDVDEHLVGVVSLRQLVVSPPEAVMDDLMDHDVIHVAAHDDQEAAARVMSRYDLLALPVVDAAGAMVGIITHDDLVDVLEQEATEDMFLMAGVGEEERASDPVPSSVRHRLPWLAVNLCTQLLLIVALNFFEPLMNSVTVLAVLYPLVTGNGGNVGSQTTTIVVRSMALGEIDRNAHLRLLWKEIAVGLINGIVVGLLAAVVAMVVARDTTVAVRVALAMVLAMTLNLAAGGLAGVLVPLSLRRFGWDPAVASMTLVTTVTDTLGAIFFLGIYILLGR